MPLAEAQGAWIAETVRGDYVAPDDTVGAGADDPDDQLYKKRFYKSRRVTPWRSTSTTTCGTWTVSAEDDPVLRRKVAASCSVPRGGGPSARCRRGVLVGAPHTSNWDWVLTILLAWTYGITIRLLVKKELLRRPRGGYYASHGSGGAGPQEPRGTIKPAGRVRGRRPVASSACARRRPARGTPAGSRASTGSPSRPPADHPRLHRRSVARGHQGTHFRPSGDVPADINLVRGFYADKTGISGELDAPAAARGEPA